MSLLTTIAIVLEFIAVYFLICAFCFKNPGEKIEAMIVITGIMFIECLLFSIGDWRHNSIGGSVFWVILAVICLLIFKKGISERRKIEKINLKKGV
ncbi:MAG: hypothetical protein PHE59_01250 [Patescibacteria group bacterium]|nr:hypothetical protein [Patescibacteria group bacterium]MDD5535021.1 hypothetical protein [Patescibacteria group bacterium]